MFLFCFEGSAAVHTDLSSEGRQIKVFKNLEAETHVQLQAAGQPRQGYTSDTGFYVRVKKPTEEGYFHFVYGVFTFVDIDANGA